MPTVPMPSNGGSVDPNGLPSVRTSADAFGAVRAGQVQQAGADIQSAADQYTMLQNQVRINDGLNQTRQAINDQTFGQEGYLAKRGQAALQPDAAGLALPDAYSQKLAQTVSDIASTLTPDQQRVFRMQAADMQTSFRGNVQQHMLQQSQAYSASVYQDTLRTVDDSVGQVWNDPQQMNGYQNPQTGQFEGGLVQQAKAAAYAAAKLTGTDPNAAILEAGSHVHTTAISMALQNQNPQYAADYLAAHKSEMTTDDLLRVQGLVTQQSTAQLVQTTVNKRAATMLQPTVAPTDFQRLDGAVRGVESSNTDFNPDGTPVMSSKGALFAHQVMPATAGDPGFGIKPADASGTPAQTAAEYNRVGTQYLAALVKHYGGDVAKATAAYHDGQGAVDKAVADADAQGDPTIWLQDTNISDAGRAYVTSVTKQYGQGGGAAPMPTKEQFVQGVLSDLGTAATPQMVSMARASAEAQYTLTTQSRQEQGQQATRQFQQVLIDNGGDMGSAVANNPDVAAAVRQYSPGEYENLTKFARSLARGENVTNMDAYGQAVSHPEDLAKLSDAEMAQFVTTNMSQADGKYLYKLRNDVMTGKVDTGPDSVNQKALNWKLNQSLRDIGIDPVAKDEETKTRIGDIQQTMVNGILSQQQAQGKKFTQADIDKFVDQQIARGTVVPRWFGLASNPQRLYATQIGDLSSADKDSITTQLQKEGLKTLTDSDIMRRYFAVKSNGQ